MIGNSSSALPHRSRWTHRNSCCSTASRGREDQDCPHAATTNVRRALMNRGRHQGLWRSRGQKRTDVLFRVFLLLFGAGCCVLGVPYFFIPYWSQNGPSKGFPTHCGCHPLHCSLPSTLISLSYPHYNTCSAVPSCLLVVAASLPHTHWPSAHTVHSVLFGSVCMCAPHTSG